VNRDGAFLIDYRDISLSKVVVRLFCRVELASSNQRKLNSLVSFDTFLNSLYCVELFRKLLALKGRLVRTVDLVIARSLSVNECFSRSSIG